MNWKITEEEKETIYDLFEKKRAIENLFIILPKESAIYPRLLEDYSEVIKNYDLWWNDMGKKYKWEEYYKLNVNLNVDFVKNEVLVVENGLSVNQ